MPVKSMLKSRVLDDKDRKILMILQNDGRAQLTTIAKKVGLSIDSVHKRIKEMQRKEIFSTGIFIEPKNIGFPFLVDVKIKLRNISFEEKEAFIAHLVSHKRVVDVISILGDFDLTCVLIARDANELEEIATQIRQKYKGIIHDWKSVLILKSHKFEKYDLM